MRLVKGDNLTEKQKSYVLSAYLYRWTVENAQRARVYRCNKCDIRTPYMNTVSANGHAHCEPSYMAESAGA